MHERLRADGPISVEAYMEACNAYYYATRDPLGAGGDFTTAPEISQMFGELVGAALADLWRRAGSPANVRYVELGPGRGTLASDALRVMRSVGLTPPVHLVETSPTLRQAQAALLGDVFHHDSIGDLPGDAPLLVVANEFLDALPIRQHVAGVERHVEWIGNGLAFDRGGEVVESSPARDEAVRALAEGLVAIGGAALVIDYGHERSAPGDTLQAVRAHRFAPVLEHPGEHDLTSHVDFQRAAEVARKAGAFVAGPAEQGAWLERLGIQARARALGNATPDRAGEIEAARLRLCRPDQMGSLFKILAIHSPEWPSPAAL
ncbi:SAM-dependent MidA family methyltransferase [Sphingomonas kaistensis]|uniref:SAM-dependent MidA family methyltransferase n=1 Tax=Sphingomonas kaistensis TaxID=298708 RepID=A0A7X5Y5A8_9SPHN|nr:SAM-dependent methyltransferase [Sphingomonas kaistensis]NJC05055.1 SAM-dependent MidA family methyltransferase [Sphingomonas kaistensis]